MNLRRFSLSLVILCCSCLSILSSHAQRPVAVWLTDADGSAQLAAQAPLDWNPAPVGSPGIRIDDQTTYQTMDGFGHALTGGSAQLLMKMSPSARKALLQELFGSGPRDIRTSYLRVTIGASDMNDHVYTYDDLPSGETDPTLAHFTIAEDEKDVIPVLKAILAIQPKIAIMASPWTAPSWMKTNGDPKAGELKPEFYDAYARYFVRYLKAMQAEGITIAAVTPQNEPENPYNTPSMILSAEQEATFIGKNLGPALAAAGLSTKIIDFDHNADHPVYTETILSDPAAARYTDGSGFHLYLGQMSALTTVHDLFPRKNIYFTEQMVIPNRDSADHSIAEPVARLIIGAPENWSRNVLLWNLAADPKNGPHTPNGGCPVCTGALTLDGDHVTRLTAYYTAAHASKFVPPGSVRIGSSGPAETLPHVAFLTPGKAHVLIVSNPGKTSQPLAILYGTKRAETTLAAGSVATYVW